MLLVKYILEDFDRQTPEVKSDIIDAIQTGLKYETLSPTQVIYTIWYCWGYTLSEIAVHEDITSDRVMELVIATLRYLSTVTNYTDEKVIYQHKGKVEPLWIAQRDQLLLSL